MDLLIFGPSGACINSTNNWWALALQLGALPCKSLEQSTWCPDFLSLDVNDNPQWFFQETLPINAPSQLLVYGAGHQTFCRMAASGNMLITVSSCPSCIPLVRIWPIASDAYRVCGIPSSPTKWPSLAFCVCYCLMISGPRRVYQLYWKRELVFLGFFCLFLVLLISRRAAIRALAFSWQTSSGLSALYLFITAKFWGVCGPGGSIMLWFQLQNDYPGRIIYVWTGLIIWDFGIALPLTRPLLALDLVGFNYTD